MAPTAPPKPQQKKVFRPAQTTPPTSLRDFFGGFGTAPRPAAPPAAAPRAPGVPRPPGNVGRSAEVPPGNFAR
jgi:hypothetical protein